MDEIVTAEECWEEAGGGGGVAAARLAELADETIFFTALGDDERGHRAKEQLEAAGVTVEVAWRSAPQRPGRSSISIAPASGRSP